MRSCRSRDIADRDRRLAGVEGGELGGPLRGAGFVLDRVRSQVRRRHPRSVHPRSPGLWSGRGVLPQATRRRGTRRPVAHPAREGGHSGHGRATRGKRGGGGEVACADTALGLDVGEVKAHPAGDFQRFGDLVVDLLRVDTRSAITPAVTFSCVHIPAFALLAAIEHIRDICVTPFPQLERARP